MKDDTDIPQNQAAEVFERASQLISQQPQNYSLEELIQAGAEAQIPPEAIKQAVQQIQDEEQQQQLKQIQRQKKIKQRLIIASITAVGFIVWLGGTHNDLNNDATKVDTKWAQVENQMQRRADLIPNLTNIAQTYAKHEKDVILSLTQARQQYLQANSAKEKLAANSSMLQAIDKFIATATANPKLQSNQLFINLQYEIAGTENRIATERMRYNEAVSGYNQSLNSFPNVLAAKILGFQSKSFFQASDNKK